MTPIRDLARELKLTGVSVREHCRTRGIAMHRRLPEGTRGGQMIAFVTDKDAKRIYRDRLASRSEPTAAA